MLCYHRHHMRACWWTQTERQIQTHIHTHTHAPTNSCESTQHLWTHNENNSPVFSSPVFAPYYLYKLKPEISEKKKNGRHWRHRCREEKYDQLARVQEFVWVKIVKVPF